MNINKLMNKYNNCMKKNCSGDCDKCEFNMPDDVWNACGVISEYLNNK